MTRYSKCIISCEKIYQKGFHSAWLDSVLGFTYIAIYDYTPIGRMTVVRIEYLSIFTIACLTIIRRFQLLSFQDFSDFFEQMYDNGYTLTFVRQC